MAEGRDIGTVVAPGAAVKVFLTASEQVRAERRAAELAGRQRSTPPATAAAAADAARRGGGTRPERRPDQGRAGAARPARRGCRARWRPTLSRSMPPSSAWTTSSGASSAWPRRNEQVSDGRGEHAGRRRSARRPVPVAAPVLAVVGRPNVGKSTLVNRILGSRQAVVEDVPGVTRDRVTYDATWRGRAFTLVDTGGWEPSIEGSPVLAARVAAQARVAVDAADAVLFVTDAVVGVTDADAAVAAVLRRSRKPVVLAANKVDDAPAEAGAHSLWSLGLGEPYAVSALHGRGSGDLLDAILGALPETPAERLEAEAGPRRVALIGRPNVGQVEPAQQAGRVRARAGRLGRRHDQGPGRRADRPRRDHLAVRRHGGHQAAGPGKLRAPTTSPRCGPSGRWSAPRSRSCSSTRASRWPSRTCGSSRW